MLKGKTAIVTGSTSGIGHGIATALADQGCNIMLNGFGEAAEIEKIRQEMASKGVKVSYSGADMSKEEAIASLIEQTEKELGAVDILVNNAGIQFVADIEKFPSEKWNQIIAINLSAAFHTIHYAVAKMKERKWGRIINIASAHGLVASAGKSAYVSAKHGIIGLTQTVALETARSGVTCNAICPGWVHTPLVEKQLRDNAAKGNISYEKAKEAMLSEKQPTHEFVTVDEIGALTVFLCSDDARSITGSAISIDGGWTAQ